MRKFKRSLGLPLKTILQAVTGICISLLFIYLALKDIHYPQLLNSLGKTDWPAWLMLLMLLGGYYGLFAWRWKYNLSAIQKIEYGSVFSSALLGLFCNNVLPARLGEFARVYFLGKKTGISKSGALATVITERSFDLAGLLLLLIYVLLVSSFPNWVIQMGVTLSLLVMGAIFTILFLIIFENQAVSILQWLGTWSPWSSSEKMKKRYQFFIVPLRQLRDIRYTSKLFAMTMMIWAVNISITYFGLHSYGLKISLSATIFAVVITQLGTIIPASPGYVGTYHFLWQLVLSIYGIDKTEALGFAILFHAYWYVPTTLTGLGILWKEGFSLSKLQAVEMDKQIVGE